MIYAAGIVGFLGGFILGQMVLFFLLRQHSNRELLHDRALKLKYGFINWVIAGLSAYGMIEMVKFYFP